MAGYGKKFVDALEATFGPYPGPLMKVAISDHYAWGTEEFMAQLYKHIVVTYKPFGSTPPALAHILEMAASMPPPTRLLLEDDERVSDEEGIKFMADLMKGLEEKE